MAEISIITPPEKRVIRRGLLEALTPKRQLTYRRAALRITHHSLVKEARYEPHHLYSQSREDG